MADRTGVHPLVFTQSGFILKMFLFNKVYVDLGDHDLTSKMEGPEMYKAPLKYLHLLNLQFIYATIARYYCVFTLDVPLASISGS